MQEYLDRIQKRYLTEHYASGTYIEDGLEAIIKYKKKFTIKNSVNYKPYYPRKEQRYTIIIECFQKYFGEKVLDVGSRAHVLTEKLGRACTLVDKNNSELPPFDWEKEQLPYEEGSFDTVVCLDTLEHIDNLHDGFYDLLRVAKKHIIISLPNPWRKAFVEFIKGRGRWPTYGIPLEPSFDRHKWFFNTEEAEDFVYYHSVESKGNYTVKEVQYHMPKTIWRLKIAYPILRFVLPEYQYKNLFTETVFFVLEKNN